MDSKMAYVKNKEKTMSEQNNDEINAAEQVIVDSAEQTESDVNKDEIIKEQDKRIADLQTALATAQKNESEAMIRARAEIDNVRKRVEQDVEKARKFALEKLSTELLVVIDNLERALSSLDINDESNKSAIEGVELTLKSFLDTMKKFGVEAINSTGEPLNPEFHQAITMIDSTDYESNHIVETMQKGYLLNGRLIRPAMVVVAK